MVHRIISSSNLELEEERDTSNGVRSLLALNVDAVLGTLLITEVLILIAWGPILIKQEYDGFPIALSIVVSVVVFTAWILLGRPGILYGMKGRIQVFLMLLSTFIFNAMIPVLIRQRNGSIYVSFLLFQLFLPFLLRSIIIVCGEQLQKQNLDREREREKERDGCAACTCYYNGNASWSPGVMERTVLNMIIVLKKKNEQNHLVI